MNRSEGETDIPALSTSFVLTSGGWPTKASMGVIPSCGRRGHKRTRFSNTAAAASSSSGGPLIAPE